MNSPLWHIVGYVSVIGFVLAVILSIVGRRLFVSDREKEADLGTKIISAVGGARNARSANTEQAKRWK